jgi:hypothetical protein
MKPPLTSLVFISASREASVKLVYYAHSSSYSCWCFFFLFYFIYILREIKRNLLAITWLLHTKSRVSGEQQHWITALHLRVLRERMKVSFFSCCCCFIKNFQLAKKEKKRGSCREKISKDTEKCMRVSPKGGILYRHFLSCSTLSIVCRPCQTHTHTHRDGKIT